MIIIADKMNSDLYEICVEAFKDESLNIDLYEQRDLIFKKDNNEFIMMTVGGTVLPYTRVLIIGKVKEDIIKFLSNSRYEGINDFKSMLKFYNQFSSYVEISKLYPNGFLKSMIYNSETGYKYERLDIEYFREVYFKAKEEVNYNTEAIRAKLEGFYNIFYFSVSYGEKDGKYYPLSIIPYLDFNELTIEQWRNIIHKEC